MRDASPRRWLLAAGLGSTAGALLHVVVALSGRADWVAFFRAPAIIVRSMRDGGWLGPLTGLAIGALMQIAGCYAFSGAGLLPRLPLLRPGLIVLAATCLLRGLLVPLSLLVHPALITRYERFDGVAAAIWGGIGLCFAIGTARQVANGRCRAPGRTN